MLTIVIPTLDRACQLDILLRSLLRYWRHEDLHINVLYKYSNESFAEGYDKLFQRYWYVNPVGEYDFGRQIISLLDKSIDSTVGFFTDDCVIYQQPNIYPSQINALFKNSKVMSFSLRLGLNTTVQNYLNGEMQPNLNYQRDDDYIVWRWSHYSGNVNWGYVYSWDGHFYDKKFIYGRIKDRDFSCPRALEHQLNNVYPMRLFGIEKPYMVSCEESSLFVNTINCVQPEGPDAGTKHGYSPDYLNNKWLGGEQISLRSFDNLDIISSHEEFPLQWESDGTP